MACSFKTHLHRLFQLKPQLSLSSSISRTQLGFTIAPLSDIALAKQCKCALRNEISGIFLRYVSRCLLVDESLDWRRAVDLHQRDKEELVHLEDGLQLEYRVRFEDQEEDRIECQIPVINVIKVSTGVNYGRINVLKSLLILKNVSMAVGHC